MSYPPNKIPDVHVAPSMLPRGDAVTHPCPPADGIPLLSDFYPAADS